MNVQTLLKVFFLIAFFALVTRQAEASHLYGSEFTYEYIGHSGNATNPFRYKVEYKIYTGNTGINRAVNFNFFTKDLTTNNNIRTLNNVQPTTTSPNPIPLPIPPGCTVANLPNIWIWTYTLTVDLPTSFNGYYVTATIGARNNDIDNLASPGSQDLYTYMEMPSPLVPSKSPVFTDTAVVVMFTGDTTTIINSAFDINGDKLIYAFNQPFGNGPTSTFVPSATVPTRINYAGGYSQAQPFGAGGYASINASTGLAKYYVPNAGNYVVSFQVKEYRNFNGDDILIGTTIRDIQLVVRNAPASTNTKPTITHNGPPSKTITISEGAAIPPLTFTFNDPNPGQLLKVTFSSPLLDGTGGRNATFNGSSASPQQINNLPSGSTATLNFTSVCGDAGTYPINISVSDGICGTSPHSETFQIEVTPYQGPNQATGDTVVCSNATKSYSVPAKASATYSWALQGGGNIVGSATSNAIQVAWTTPGRYMLTVTETSTGNCTATFSFHVNVTPGIALTVSPPVTICAGSSPVTLTASGGTTYSWTDGTNNYTGANITVNPTATTTYTVSSTATGGCVATGSVTVTVNQLPTINPGNNRSVCAGQSTTLSATGAGTGGTYTWTDGTNTYANNASVTPTTTTTYTVTGTTATNCPNTAQVTVTVTPLPVVNAGADQAICPGASATLSATGATTYTWTNGTNTFTGQTITVNPTATTTYTVTGTANGCTSTDQVTVTVNPRPTISGTNRTICIGQSTTLVATGADTYTWTSGSTTLTGNNLTVSPTATTTYTVTGTTTANGCTNTATVTVTVNPLPVIPAMAAQTICSGATATLTVGTPAANTTYSWTGGPTTLTGASVTVSPTATTTYTVTAINTLTTCQNTATVTVTVTPLPTVSAGADQIICTGTSATLSATGATTYTWTNGTNTFTGQTITVNPTATTTYTVTGTANGCTSTDQVTVTVNPRPTISGTNRTICIGQSTTLVATGADTYTWTSGSTTLTGNTLTVSPTATTTYTVTGTITATGCTNTATVTVTVNPLPVIPAMAAQTICSGATATLTVGTPAANTTYSWTGGPTTLTGASVTVSPTATTTYTVTATNTLTTCTNTATVTVTVNPLPVVAASASQGTICPGQSTTLTATGATTYTWTNGTNTFTGNNITVNPTTTTTYTVTGTNTATNCSNTATVTVTVNPTPTVTVTNRTICIGQSTTLVAAGAATYSWTDGTTTYTGNNVSVSPTATTVYTVTGTSAAGCTNTAQLTVTVNPLPVIPGLAPQTICNGATATLSVGTPAANTTYSWTGGPTTLTGASVTVSPTATTTYTVTATNTVTTCTNTATVTVTVNPKPTAVPGAAQTVCSTEPVIIGAAAVPGLTYSWSPAAGLSSTTVANPTATIANTGTTPIIRTYYLIVTNGFNCTATDSVKITVKPLPVSNAGTDKTICSGASTTLGAAATTGYTYSWAPVTGLSSATVANPTITLTNTTTAPVNHTYTVTTTLNGCVTTDQVVVTVNPAITVDAGTDKTLCDLKSVVVGTPAVAGYSYSWAANSGLSNLTSAMPVFTASNTTANPVTVKLYVTATAFGCSKTDSVNVTINPRPVSDSINGNPSVCPGVQGVPYTVRNPRLTSYQWIVTGGTIDSGQGTDSITVNWGAAGTGTVKVFSLNSFGCSSDTVTLPVTINPILITATPTGPTQLCAYEANNIRYQVPLITPGSVYTYQAIGGTITSANPSINGVMVNWNGAGIGKLIVTETSTTSLANCFGVSDTLFVTIMPSPDTTLAITGTAKACEFTQQLTYSISGGTNSTYAWKLNGTNLASTSNNVTIDLGAAGVYTLTVLETNAQGCPGRVISKTITSTPLPGTLTINGPANICPENLARNVYFVTGNLGSTFNWTVTGSSGFTGNGTSIIHVDFDNSPVKSISVVETTADGCVGNQFTLPLTFDKANLRFDAASTAEINDTEVVLNLAMTDNQANKEQITIYRRQAGTAAWTQIGSVNNTASTFTDSQVNTLETVYEYKAESQNECGTKLETNIHNTIVLQSQGDEKQGVVMLNWNSYKGWASGVKEYQVYRKLDNESDFTLVTLNGTALTDTTITLPAKLVGFSQCYRIKAIGNNNQVSWSNGACADFANELEFYNVITPDGDALNEAFVIKNVELYKGSELTIMNRWGNEVFKAKDYKNTWKGDNVANGVYYYLLKLPNGKTYKGWVEVIK